MGDRRWKLLNISTASGGVGQTLATSEPIPVSESGRVSVICVVDNGTDDVVPTGSPSGALKMYASASGNAPVPFVPVTTADADLAAISPAGNNANVKGVASFEAVPGIAIKVVYQYASGGGAGSRMRVWVVA